MSFRSQVRGRDVDTEAPAKNIDAWSMHAKKTLGEPYLPVAKLANIPAEKNISFLYSVHAAVNIFQMSSQVDVESRKFKDAIRGVETASAGLLRALKYLEDQKAGVFLDARFSVRLQDDPKTRLTDSQWDLFRSTNYKLWTLDDCKRRIVALEGVAKDLIRRVPKKSENRTKQFIARILELVYGSGGNLTYNKNKHTRTLAEVYEFFRARAPAGTWTNLSPSTLDRLLRLSKRRRIVPITRV